MRWAALITILAVAGAFAATLPPDRIIADYEKGVLDRQEELSYLIRYVKDYEALPVEYRNTEGVVIGSYTPYITYVLDHLDEVDDPARGEILDLLARPSSVGHVESDEYSIWFHYFDSSYLAYATQSLGYAEIAWGIETEDGDPDRLWPPPPDGFAGGSSDYDFYLEDITGGVMGYCVPESQYGGDPDRYGFTSYIAIDIGMTEAYLRSTISHELGHAIQFGADYAEQRLMEAGATYRQNLVYPGSGHAYYQTSDFQAYPQYTLINASGMYQYGAWIWYKFLDLVYFDEDGYWYDDMYRNAVQPDSTNDPSIFETLDDLLADEGSNLTDAYLLFSVWRVFAGTYSDDYHWPVDIPYDLTYAWSHPVSDYPLDDFSVPDERLPQKMGMNLVLFSTNTNPEMFAVSFDGQNEAGQEHRVWKVAVAGIRRDSGEPDVWEMDVDNEYNYGSLIVDDWSLYSKLALIVCNYGDDNLDPDDPDSSMWGRAGTYTYSAWITDAGADVSDLAGRAVDEGVLLTWRAEGDISGFNVYRGTERLNALPLDTEAVSYLDRGGSGGEYYLGLIDPAGVEVRYGPVAVDPADSGSRMMKLEQNFPSPVAGTTTIRFALAEAGPVELSVYDLSGRLVDTVVDGELEAGPHTCVWDASGRADGVYLYTLTTPDGSLTRRLVVAR
jgi:hypothetical protein